MDKLDLQFESSLQYVISELSVEREAHTRNYISMILQNLNFIYA